MSFVEERKKGGRTGTEARGDAIKVVIKDIESVAAGVDLKAVIELSIGVDLGALEDQTGVAVTDCRSTKELCLSLDPNGARDVLGSREES